MKKLAMVAVVGLSVAGFVAAASADAGDHPVNGRKILLKNGKKIIVLVKNDAGIEAPTQEELDAATAASLTVCAENGEGDTEALDVTAFSLNKKGILKYKVKGATGVKNILVKSGRTLKIVGKDPIVPMTEGEDLGGVSVRLTIGDMRTCTTFDTPKKDGGKLFKAKDGTAPADCDDVTLGCVPAGSPSGAFVR